LFSVSGWHSTAVSQAVISSCLLQYNIYIDEDVRRKRVFYSQRVLTLGHLGSRRSWVHGSKLPKLQHERWDSGLCL